MPTPPVDVSASIPPVDITTSWMAAWFMKKILPVPPPAVTEALTDIPSHRMSPSVFELPCTRTWPHVSPTLPPTSCPPPRMSVVAPTVSAA